MGILKHIRSRSKVKQQESQQSPERSGPDILTTMPKELAGKIFEHVCAHTRDETFEVCERSVVPGCGLCDLRDLFNCALVNRRWYLAVQKILYRSVRIDALHFCPLEEAHSETRRRKNIDPSSIIPTRLSLFERTAWARPDVASSVLFFKLAHQARGANIPTLARIVSALPNLRHVDLPDGFFSAEPSTRILRDQLQAHCWDIRRLKYTAGAEQAFHTLGQRNLWTSMEVLELERLQVNMSTLRHVLASLPALQELSLSSLSRLDDTAFRSTPSLPPFSAVHKLHIINAPRVTFAGLADYTSRPEVREVLSHVSLQNTGALTGTIHTFLEKAQNLSHLSITQTVTDSPSLDSIPPLSSTSLKTLHYELSSPPDASDMATSHYAYLTRSLLARALPNLKNLYVLDGNFVESLQITPAPPIPPQQPTANMPSRLSSNNPYSASAALSPTSSAPAPTIPPTHAIATATATAKALSIHAKPTPDSPWRLTALASALPNPSDRRSSRAFHHHNAAPHGSRAPSADAKGGRRVSVVVPAPGPGGGFLAVPMPMPSDSVAGGGGIGGIGAGRNGGVIGGDTDVDEDAWPVDGVGFEADAERGYGLARGTGRGKIPSGSGGGGGGGGFWRRGGSVG